MAHDPTNWQIMEALAVGAGQIARLSATSSSSTTLSPRRLLRLCLLSEVRSVNSFKHNLKVKTNFFIDLFNCINCFKCKKPEERSLRAQIRKRLEEKETMS